MSNRRASLLVVMAWVVLWCAPPSRAALRSADAPAPAKADAPKSDAPKADAPAAEAPPQIVAKAAGKYEITFDIAETPELREWVETKLKPVCVEWYPKIVEMLPSEGFEAPERLTVRFRKEMQGVANTRGTLITCAGPWFSKNLKGEAVGAVVHELVHVVQQYGRARRTNPDAARNPGWLVEGVPDYIRWYLYEPQSHGADIRNADRARYDASYRVTANFLNYVTGKYDKDLARKLNAAMREGKYSDDLWKQITGKTVEELGQEWKESLKK